MTNRTTQSLGDLNIDGFKPRSKATRKNKTQKPVDQDQSDLSWQSREAAHESNKVAHDATLSMRGPAHVINRFKKLAKADRYSQWAFLEVLMQHYEDYPPNPRA